MKKSVSSLIVPDGTRTKAQIGLKLLKESALEFIDANPQGIKNSQLAHYLDLHSDNNGNQKDYLTYSILGLLMKEGRIKKSMTGLYVRV